MRLLDIGCCISLPMICLTGWITMARAENKSDTVSDVPGLARIARTDVEIFRVEEIGVDAEIDRIENPVFRYSEHVRGPALGALWLWGTKGRPVAVLEMIRRRDADWFCFHATSDKPLKLTAQTGQVWTPESSDLRFDPLPDAPLPAETAPHRMRQMKEFVQRFTAYELFTDGRHEMRVLPAAVHRYEDQEARVIDGAIFVIAIGTHPEATLFLEAVCPASDAASIWKFAIGRSGAAEMIVKYDDKEVRHLPVIETFPMKTSSYWRMALKKDAEK